MTLGDKAILPRLPNQPHRWNDEATQEGSFTGNGKEEQPHRMIVYGPLFRYLH